MKRPFYILHHNPNEIGDPGKKGSAWWALTHGANALAPDVVFWKKDFYVMHYNNPFERHKGRPLFTEYLSALSRVLDNNPHLQPKLLAFDLKNTDDSPYPFEALQRVLRENFSHKFPETLITFSTPDDLDFLIHGVAPCLEKNQALGTDEYDNPQNAWERLGKTGVPIVYGYGNATFFNTLRDEISKAVKIRDGMDSFRMVYPWVIDGEKNFRLHLDLGVDAIMTNEPGNLQKLITEEYADKFELNAGFTGFK